MKRYSHSWINGIIGVKKTILYKPIYRSSAIPIKTPYLTLHRNRKETLKSMQKHKRSPMAKMFLSLKKDKDEEILRITVMKL